MKNIDREIDRCLNLLRNKIRHQGFTQIEVQDTLSWGRSYISQLLTRQKQLRIDQALAILNVIGVDPADFFAELYNLQGAPGSARGRRENAGESASVADLSRELKGLRDDFQGLMNLLVENQLITVQELRVSKQLAIVRGREGRPVAGL